MAKKNSAAVELGRLGGQKKVPKGFSMMEPGRRTAVAKQAAEKRWGKKGKEVRTRRDAGFIEGLFVFLYCVVWAAGLFLLVGFVKWAWLKW